MLLWRQRESTGKAKFRSGSNKLPVEERVIVCKTFDKNLASKLWPINI